MSRRTIARIVSVVLVGASCVFLADTAQAESAATDGHGHRTVTVDTYQFRVLAQASVPGWVEIDNVPVGGLSGIDYDPTTGSWAAISDDRSDRGPARFYRLRVNPQQDAQIEGCDAGVVTLLRADGTPYPPSATAGADTVQPEAVRFDATTGDVFWVNAGERNIPADGSEPVLVDPSVRESSTGGQFVSQLLTSARLRASTGETGIRQGRGYGGLTFSTNGLLAVSAVSGPLLQDGVEPTATSGANVRVTMQSRTVRWAVTSQYVYPLDKLPLTPVAGGAASNEVAEILAVDAQKYLVLERGYAEGVGHSVRLYEVDFSSATNVAGVSSLVGATFTPGAKRLLLDLKDLSPSGGVANFQGMTWGPTLPSGERTLTLVSDNDLDPGTPSTLLTLAMLAA